MVAAEILGERKRSPNSAKAVAHYLLAVRALVKLVASFRQDWLRRVGPILYQRGESRGGLLSVDTAERIGLEGRREFQAALQRMTEFEVPESCATCHSLLCSWLQKQVEACEMVVEATPEEARRQYRYAIQLLVDARHDLREFQDESIRLVGWLRTRTRTASIRQSVLRASHLLRLRRRRAS
jgi:hypothetical protein